MTDAAWCCPYAFDAHQRFLTAARRCAATGHMCWNYAKPDAVERCIAKKLEDYRRQQAAAKSEGVQP